MDISTQTSLCKGLRACGIPKEQTHEILDIVSKWYDCSGIEWTNQRIKDYRQWYESYLAGNPTPPEWFRRTKDHMPTGIWNWVFHLPTSKALAVLSLNTVFYESRLSEAQEKKFNLGLEGNLDRDPRVVSWVTHRSESFYGIHLPKKMPDLTPVSITDIEKSCPIDGSTRTATPTTDGEKLIVLSQSWESLPQVTFDFLERNDRYDIMPPSVFTNGYRFDLERKHCEYVGRIGVIQEPQLKARIVANPNRITQHTLEPLQILLGGVAEQLASSCIYDQESGMTWVQNQLIAGNCMAGSDLTSASDLLDLELSEQLVRKTFNLDKIEDYRMYAQYFKEVSRSQWYFPQSRKGARAVHWSQGDPLGTGPSIFYLDLTNCAAGILAYDLAVREGWNPPYAAPHECFRTIGDDIIMFAEMQPYYERVIQSLGGKINHSKTLISDKVAEFAGRVITTKGVYLKKVNYREPSDNSFMSYMSELGDQAKWFLRPRQRKVYDRFWPVPGIVVSGPWNRDSFGERLSDRYQWYLEEVQPAFSREEPDPDPETNHELLLRADLENQSRGLSPSQDVYNPQENVEDFVLPFLDDDVFLTSRATTHAVHGDPRLTNGKTALEVMESNLDVVLPYPEWKANQELSLLDRNASREATSPETEETTVSETIESMTPTVSQTVEPVKLTGRKRKKSRTR